MDHKIHFCKLNFLGITGKAAKWIETFLEDRKQKEEVGRHYSDWTRVKSGVLQGTVFGPMLFLAYITDISARVDSSVLCFADDTRISRTVISEDGAHQLQRDLDIVYF